MEFGPRIEEVVGDTTIVCASNDGTQRIAVSDLASQMLPRLEHAMIEGLSDAQSTERKLFFAQQTINSKQAKLDALQSRMDALQSNFEKVVRGKSILEKKLSKVAMGDTEFIRKLQGVDVWGLYKA